MGRKLFPKFPKFWRNSGGRKLGIEETQTIKNGDNDDDESENRVWGPNDLSDAAFKKIRENSGFHGDHDESDEFDDDDDDDDDDDSGDDGDGDNKEGAWGAEIASIASSLSLPADFAVSRVKSTTAEPEKEKGDIRAKEGKAKGKHLNGRGTFTVQEMCAGFH